MKYVLMTIMFLCSLGICFLVNRGKEDRIVVLKEIKQSIKAFDIHQYFLGLNTGDNKHLPSLVRHVDNVANNRSKPKETKQEMFDDMHRIFIEKSDSSMLSRWLTLVKKPNDSIKRDEVEKQCNTLIEKTKGEEKSNIYIAIALGVVLIIILI